jgi:flavin-binding protein dodecin
MQRWSTKAQASRGRQNQTPTFMKDKVYKLIELTGTSTKSIEDAVNTALKRAGRTIQNLGWFQIVETRGSIEKNQVRSWQVTIKVGFTVD